MIHALPGMGADIRMYPQPWDTLPNFVAHNWDPSKEFKSIHELAQATCDVCAIKDGDVLVGSSLGGIVACEITKIRKISRLYLIASACTKKEINPILSAIHPIANIAPISWLQFSASKVDANVMQMFSDANPQFIRAMCSAVFAWDGLSSSDLPLHRIHGKSDKIIPLPVTVDLAIEGGHLISISHARECVEYISNVEQQNANK